jgi:hypothetical protein
MAAKQAPSKAEKTTQPLKHIRKNRETIAEEITTEKTT